MELVKKESESDRTDPREEHFGRAGIIALAAAVITVDAFPLLFMGMAFVPFLFLVVANVAGMVLGGLLYKEIITLPQQTYGRFLPAEITARSFAAESRTENIDKRKAA